MANEERRRRREFLWKYRELNSIIYWEFPDFWGDLSALEGRNPEGNLRRAEEEEPGVRDVGVQVGWAGCHLRDATTQTGLASGEGSPERTGPMGRVERKPERPPERPRATKVEAARKPGPAKPTPKIEDPGEPLPVSPAGCWNCGSRIHRYSRCPRPRERVFCFACGYINVSIKDCPRCGGEWAKTAARHGARK
jgi:hypothetical protein